VIVVVVVIVPIVLGAIMYVMVSGLVGSTPNDYGGPNIHLGQAEPSAGNVWRVTVAGVSSAEPLFLFMVMLWEDFSPWLEIDPLAEGTYANVSFVDLDGGGTLSTGDYFDVTCSPDSDYELLVIWRETGSLKAEESWRTP
jgi:hypothetical protein